VRFDPFALIKGTARFGYRDFKPVDPSLPGYSGSTASADLTYTFQGATRIGFTATRDIQYSYDVNQPYYLLTGFNVSLAQQVYGPLDAVVRFGLQHLDYQDRTGATIEVSDRQDSVRTFGGGVGYHLGQDLRIGFNVDKSRRITDVSRRRYNGLIY